MDNYTSFANSKKPNNFFLSSKCFIKFFQSKISWILKIENKVKMERLKNYIEAVHHVV